MEAVFAPLVAAFAQLSHAIVLNDVCDWMRLKSDVLARFGVTPPSKNGLSNANKDRSAEFVEKLFWSVLGHLQHASPDFAAGRKGKGLLRRVEALARTLNSPESPIVIVDHSPGWISDPSRPETLTVDWVHPNLAGDERLAHNWFEALKKVLTGTKQISLAPNPAKP